VDYFFYNTDVDAFGGAERYQVLFDEGIAATSGPRSYGEQLGRLKPGDHLLMYANGLGVVAVGSVLEFWDGRTHRKPLYYGKDVSPFSHEYRIRVDWTQLSDDPITISQLKSRIGYVPHGAVPKIVTWRREIELLIEGRLKSKPRIQGTDADRYTPVDGDERAVIERQIRVRRGQQRFRESLRARYRDQCLVTGCTILDLLEAAHVIPYRGAKDNHPENGLLLRADIHTLFDLDLLGIHPESLRIEIVPNLESDPEYQKFAGTKIDCGSAGGPSRVALKTRYEQFRERQKGK
jgi:hypothetical protein